MEDVSLLSLLGRLVISLGVVLVLMVLLARVLKGRMTPGGAKARRPGRPIEVVARQALGRNASVAVVKVGHRQLVLGVTDSNVNILADTEDEDDFEEERADWTPLSPGMPTGVTPSPTWRDMVERLRERTVRRS